MLAEVTGDRRHVEQIVVIPEGSTDQDHSATNKETQHVDDVVVQKGGEAAKSTKRPSVRLQG